MRDTRAIPFSRRTRLSRLENRSTTNRITSTVASAPSTVKTSPTPWARRT